MRLDGAATFFCRRSGAVSFDEFYKWFVFSRNPEEKKPPGLDAIVPPRDRAIRKAIAAYHAGELTLSKEDMKPPPPKAAKRRVVHDEPPPVEKKTLAQRLAEKGQAVDTQDSVIKRRFQAARKSTTGRVAAAWFMGYGGGSLPYGRSAAASI